MVRVVQNCLVHVDFSFQKWAPSFSRACDNEIRRSSAFTFPLTDTLAHKWMPSAPPPPPPNRRRRLRMLPDVGRGQQDEEMRRSLEKKALESGSLNDPHAQVAAQTTGPNGRNFNWEFGHIQFALGISLILYQLRDSETQGWTKGHKVYAVSIIICVSLAGIGLVASTVSIHKWHTRGAASACSRVASSIATFLLIFVLSKPVSYVFGSIFGSIVVIIMFVIWALGNPEDSSRAWYFMKNGGVKIKDLTKNAGMKIKKLCIHESEVQNEACGKDRPNEQVLRF